MRLRGVSGVRTVESIRMPTLPAEALLLHRADGSNGADRGNRSHRPDWSNRNCRRNRSNRPDGGNRPVRRSDRCDWSNRRDRPDRSCGSRWGNCSVNICTTRKLP